MEVIAGLLSLFGASFAAWPIPVTLAVLAATFVLWVLFVSVTVMARRIAAEQAGTRRLPVLLLLYVIGYGVLILGLVVDVAYNATVGWLLFRAPPAELTLTERLRKLIAGPRGTLRDRAIWVCTHLIEPWDQNHCGLAKIGRR